MMPSVHQDLCAARLLNSQATPDRAETASFICQPAQEPLTQPFMETQLGEAGPLTPAEAAELWEEGQLGPGHRHIAGLEGMALPVFRLDKGGDLVLVQPLQDTKGAIAWPFHSGRAYVVMGRRPEGGKPVVYYWVGKEAGAAVVATITIRAVELSRALKGRGTTQREDEGSESQELLSNLAFPLQVREPGLDSSDPQHHQQQLRRTHPHPHHMHHASHQQPKLFHVVGLSRGSGFTLVCRPLDMAELQPQRVLLLEHFSARKLYLWYGSNTSAQLRGFGLEAASYLTQEDAKGSSLVSANEGHEPMGFLSLFPTSFVDSDEHSEPTSPASPLVSAASPSSSGASSGRRLLPPLSLYTVPPSYPASPPTMSLWYLDSPVDSSPAASSSPLRSPGPEQQQHGVPVVARHTHGLGPCLTSLRSDHAYILDQGHEVFVWLGQASAPAIRTDVSQLADRVAAGRRVLRVRQGREPFVFLCKFADGLKAVARQTALCATPHGLQRNKEEGGQVRVRKKAGDAYDAMLVSALAAMQEARRRIGAGQPAGQQQHQRGRTLTAASLASSSAMMASSGGSSGSEETGQQQGGVLACWVLDEAGGMTRLGPDECAHLYSHYSYLLLHVPADEASEARAYFWQGLRAPVSDGVRWELHVRKAHVAGAEWLGLLGGDRHVRIERVRQGHEPASFHALMSPRSFIFHDRVWRRRGDGGTRTCLYRVRAPLEGGPITVSQVECAVRSLNTRDAFICLRVVTAAASSSSADASSNPSPPASSSAVWFWVGKEADPHCQEAGAAAAFEVMEYYALSSEEVEVDLIEETELGQEPVNPQVEHRWASLQEALNGGVSSSSSSSGAEGGQKQQQAALVRYVRDSEAAYPPLLFLPAMTNAGLLTFTALPEFSQLHLQDEAYDCAVLDTQTAIYLWARAPPSSWTRHTKLVLEAAYAHREARGLSTPINVVQEFDEPWDFRKYFLHWVPSYLPHAAALDEELERRRLQESPDTPRPFLLGRVLTDEEAEQYWQEQQRPQLPPSPPSLLTDATIHQLPATPHTPPAIPHPLNSTTSSPRDSDPRTDPASRAAARRGRLLVVNTSTSSVGSPRLQSLSSPTSPSSSSSSSSSRSRSPRRPTFQRPAMAEQLHEEEEEVIAPPSTATILLQASPRPVLDDYQEAASSIPRLLQDGGAPDQQQRPRSSSWSQRLASSSSPRPQSPSSSSSMAGGKRTTGGGSSGGLNMWGGQWGGLTPRSASNPININRNSARLLLGLSTSGSRPDPTTTTTSSPLATSQSSLIGRTAGLSATSRSSSSSSDGLPSPHHQHHHDDEHRPTSASSPASEGSHHHQQQEGGGVPSPGQWGTGGGGGVVPTPGDVMTGTMGGLTTATSNTALLLSTGGGGQGAAGGALGSSTSVGGGVPLLVGQQTGGEGLHTTASSSQGSSTGRSLTSSLGSSHGSSGGVASPRSVSSLMSSDSRSTTPSLLAAKSSRLMFPRAAFPVRADHAHRPLLSRPNTTTHQQQQQQQQQAPQQAAGAAAAKDSSLPAPMSVSSWVGTSASRTPRESDDGSSVGSSRRGGGGALSPSRW